MFENFLPFDHYRRGEQSKGTTWIGSIPCVQVFVTGQFPDDWTWLLWWASRECSRMFHRQMLHGTQLSISIDSIDTIGTVFSLGPGVRLICVSVRPDIVVWRLKVIQTSPMYTTLYPLKLSSHHVNVTIVDLIKRHRGQSLQPRLARLWVSEGSREMSRTVVYRH